MLSETRRQLSKDLSLKGEGIDRLSLLYLRHQCVNMFQGLLPLPAPLAAYRQPSEAGPSQCGWRFSMNIITVPQGMSLYPGLAPHSVLNIRMQLGMSRISLHYRQILNFFAPVLVINCFSDRGKLYPLRYPLPPDTAQRTERRVSLLLHLLRERLTDDVPA